MSGVLNSLNENNKNILYIIQTANSIFVNTMEAFNKTDDSRRKYLQEVAQTYFNYVKSLERSANSNYLFFHI
ncbi:MAG: hypothetical protein ACPKQO_10390 [Nitrososphaeraceae archaeon]